jgi:hypothetical protein
MMDIDEQIKVLMQEFEFAGIKIETALDQGLVDAGNLVISTAKKSFRSRDDESIYGAPPRNQTMRLRNSLTSVLKQYGQTRVCAVGTSVEYAQKLERGSVPYWPHPFLAPALQVNRVKIYKIIQGALKNAT